MEVKEFNKLYGGRKQGMIMLTQMRSMAYQQDAIANHFGVTKERVRQWMLEFFGSEYDPRIDRKDRMISNMEDFAKIHTEEEFREAYNGSEYFDEVLKKCKKLFHVVK